MPLRLVFMGTPPFAAACLAAIVGAGHKIAAVYTRPPRPAGRGLRLEPSETHRMADRLGLPVRTPASFRDPAEGEAFAALGADAAVVAAYGLILPRAVLAAPRLGAWNVHASLLPRWRGAAPIERAILAGDAETGISIMRMEEGLDTGPVALAERTAIAPRMTGGMLHDALAGIGARLIVEALALLEAGRLQAVPQPAEGVTNAPKVTRAEGRLTWRDAIDADRRIRAFAPAPGAWFEHRGERIRVLVASPVPEAHGDAGTLLDDRLTVACAAGGAIRLEVLQRPGRTAMGSEAFLRGYALPPGSRLGEG
jgi:methionyl-tRNA formyltransferase